MPEQPPHFGDGEGQQIPHAPGGVLSPGNRPADDGEIGMGEHRQGDAPFAIRSTRAPRSVQVRRDNKGEIPRQSG
jgi:hypothetical protein